MHFSFRSLISLNQFLPRKLPFAFPPAFDCSPENSVNRRTVYIGPWSNRGSGLEIPNSNVEIRNGRGMRVGVKGPAAVPNAPDTNLEEPTLADDSSTSVNVHIENFRSDYRLKASPIRILDFFHSFQTPCFEFRIFLYEITHLKSRITDPAPRPSSLVARLIYSGSALRKYIAFIAGLGVPRDPNHRS